MPSISLEFWLLLVALVGLVSTAAALRYAQLQAKGRKRLRRALTKHMRRSLVRERTRKQFLMAVGHDLRQPLQAAGMFAEVLTVRMADSPHLPVVERLVQAIESTNSLLSTLIDATSIDLGQIEINTTTIHVGQFLEALFLETELRALHKSLRFKLHTVDQVIVSDPVLLERLVRNLLVNAITYTQTGGVLLGCRFRPHQIGIQVVDTGMGIDQDHLTPIFEDFIRFAPQNSDGNLGLGLGVVRRVAELLGHQIEVKSKIGKGSCFTVWVDRA